MSTRERRSGPLPPDFLILGAQKCGTTSLAAALRTHPQVFLPAAKEAHHFGKVDDDDVCGDDYRRFFREWSGQPVVGEATPTYLSWPRSAEQICRFLPGVKGIVVLRNPVDRVFSGYWHEVRLGAETRTFTQSIEAELRGDCSVGAQRLLSGGRYAEQLERYLRLGFDRERMLVLFLDEFVSDGTRALREVQQFLGIGVHVSSFPQRNASGRHFLPRPLVRVLAPRWRSPWVGPILDRTRRPFVPPPMDPDLRARLVDHYRPHNARLAELLGRDLPGWDR